MSVDIASHSESSIPFMKQSVTHQILNDSCNIYNSLLPETLLSINQEDEEHAARLGEMIRNGGGSDKITVIALHCHKQLPPNHSWVGCIEPADESYVYLTRDVANETIALDMTCGHKFRYIEGKGLCPFAFCQGETFDLSGIDEELVSQIVQYLIDKRLTSRFGFGFLIPKLSKDKWTEYQLPDGMILVKTQLLAPEDQTTTVKTEWWYPDPAGTYDVGIDCQSSPTGGGHIEPPPVKTPWEISALY